MGFVRVNDKIGETRQESPLEKRLKETRQFLSGSERFLKVQEIETLDPKITVKSLSKLFRGAPVPSVSNNEIAFENTDFRAYFSWRRVAGKSTYFLSGTIERKVIPSPVPNHS